MDEKRSASVSLLRKLAFGSSVEKAQALFEIRLFSKWDMDNRICLAEAGAIPLLVNLLASREAKIQENAITALLNLSIYPGNKEAIVKSEGAVDAIVNAIQKGTSSDTRANGAAVLFSLLVEESFRSDLGSLPSLVPALLDLLQVGSTRCKTDSLKALFHLSLCPENKVRLVAAGLVPLLLLILLQEKVKLTEYALAVLAQVTGCPEGACALRRSTAIPAIVNLLDKGSSRTQENAAATLLNLCQSGGEKAKEDVLDTYKCVPALRSLNECGTPRGKSKAESLMKILDLQ